MSTKIILTKQAAFSIKTLEVFKAALYFCNLAAITIYVLLRLLFNGYKFSTTEETMIFIKTIAIGSLLALGIAVLYFLAITAKKQLRKKIQFNFNQPVKRLAWSFFILMLFSFSACNHKTVAGIKKDFNTGLTASYKNLEPEKTLLVMNGEVLNHTDIPLGESFVLVNDNVEGLAVKDGKVAVGCALKITDKNGKEILDEADLFQNGGVFNKEDAHYLKCTVSTGEPMLWDESYHVQVKFWDKYGDGSIENNLSIHIIDLP